MSRYATIVADPPWEVMGGPPWGGGSSKPLPYPTMTAHDLVRAWGFAPKTICTWVKTHKDNPCRVSMKTGYYFRGATEHWIFAVRGSLRLQTSEGLPTAYLWPRLPHSVKPDAFYDLVEKASPGPYLEMFSRRSRFGWDYWGNESLGTAEVAVA